jgi:hypothetical protein
MTRSDISDVYQGMALAVPQETPSALRALESV